MRLLLLYNGRSRPYVASSSSSSSSSSTSSSPSSSSISRPQLERLRSTVRPAFFARNKYRSVWPMDGWKVTDVKRTNEMNVRMGLVSNDFTPRMICIFRYHRNVKRICIVFCFSSYCFLRFTPEVWYIMGKWIYLWLEIERLKDCRINERMWVIW